MGFEMIAISAPENKDLGITETIKMGTRKIMLRLILLYILSTLVAGFNVPYTDAYLRDLSINSFPSGEHSIFVLAAVRNHIRGWPHFFNGFFIFSATSAGINALYFSSRILHALAGIEDAWPSIFDNLRCRLERTHKGVPYNAISTSWLFGILGFLATKHQPSVVSRILTSVYLYGTDISQALGRIAINSAVSMLIVYSMVCWSYLDFYTWLVAVW
jgi:amino acid transporter